MGSAYIQFRLEGIEEMVQNLARLGQDMAGPIAREAVKAAVEPMEQAMHAKALTVRAPRGLRTGLLASSIGMRVKQYRASETTVAVVGPKAGVVGVDARGRKEVPTKIAHLIEFGHEIVRKGKVVGRAPAYPFIRPGFEASKAQVEERLAAELRNRLENWKPA